MKKLVIWDLDGTLIDTSKGIFNSVRYAERQRNLIPVPEEQLRDWIGPKVIDSYLSHYAISQEEATFATLAHREYGINHAIFEAEVYHGITTLVRELNKKGVLQAVATMKPQEMAEKILEHFQLSSYFSSIVGMDDENKRTKSGNIQCIMSELQISPMDTIVIGDTNHDLHGAMEKNTSFIPVGHGYGFKGKMQVEFLGKQIYSVPDVSSLSEVLYENY